VGRWGRERHIATSATSTTFPKGALPLKEPGRLQDTTRTVFGMIQGSYVVKQRGVSLSPPQSLSHKPISRILYHSHSLQPRFLGP
jgi:hypothetical protein